MLVDLQIESARDYASRRLQEERVQREIHSYRQFSQTLRRMRIHHRPPWMKQKRMRKKALRNLFEKGHALFLPVRIEPGIYRRAGENSIFWGALSFPDEKPDAMFPRVLGFRQMLRYGLNPTRSEMDQWSDAQFGRWISDYFLADTLEQAREYLEPAIRCRHRYFVLTAVWCAVNPQEPMGGMRPHKQGPYVGTWRPASCPNDEDCQRCRRISGGRCCHPEYLNDWDMPGVWSVHVFELVK